MDNLKLLKEKYNYSIWLDYLDRDLIENKLDDLINKGYVLGITTNPTIFNKAITNVIYYKNRIKELKESNYYKIVEKLMMEDVKYAANKLLKVYEETQGYDGLVSIEVPPYIAYDPKATIDKAIEIFNEISMPNILIKVPGTLPGLKAIETLLYKGININITLLFSINNYKQVLQAYVNALNKRIQENLDIKNIVSVASFFVSRVDTAVDNLLLKINNSNITNRFLGKLAIFNSYLAYIEYQKYLENEFKFIVSKGGKYQRILWASTSTKNPNYHPLKYVYELFLPNSINTLPYETLNILINEHSKNNIDENIFKLNLEKLNKDYILNEIKELNKYINFEWLLNELEYKGVSLFSDSYNEILYNVINNLEIVNA
jgi:transaldolase